MALRAALALTLLMVAAGSAHGETVGATPGPVPSVACRRADLVEHPLRDSQGAAQFYYGLPLELLDAEQRAFLAGLFKGSAGCSLTAGPAKLAGQPGLLVTLAYADGVTLQAFCRGNDFKSCQVRSRQGSEAAGPWAPGALQLIQAPTGSQAAPANLETVEIELVSGQAGKSGAAKPQQLGSFRAPAQLLQAQPEGL
ncbi:MAG: hypothetical protein ACKO2W_04305 [Vulcanococcus sp.]